MFNAFQDLQKSVMKGLNKVNRTTASNDDSLDPLSMFAVQNQQEQRKVSEDYVDPIAVLEPAPKVVPPPKPVVTDSNEVLSSPNPTFLNRDNRSSSPLPNTLRSNNETRSENERPKSNSIFPSFSRAPMSPTPQRTKSDQSPTPGTPSEDIPEEKIAFLSGEVRIMCLIDASIHVISHGSVAGSLFMTNYRIIFIPSKKETPITSPSILSWLNIPLGVIDKLEKEKKSKESISLGIQILITCKDCRQIRINVKSTTPNSDYEIDRAFNLMTAYVFPNNVRHLFAYSHTFPRRKTIDLMEEYKRLGIFNHSTWRISLANQEFKLCSSYPEMLIVPEAITDDELFAVAGFRSGQRLPTLCWGSRTTGVTLWRSSQPKAGVSGTCYQDEKLLDLVAKSMVAMQHNNPLRYQKPMGGAEPLLFIVDCRSRTSAMANRAAGAGYESQANYINTRLEFYNIPNIHAVRDSYKSLVSILLNPSANPSSDITFSKQLEDTQWLTNIRLILKASWDTATMLLKGVPVLVHCSHGWDRTAQVSALSQLMLDPYYRTIEGFITLLEKEWLSFGHPFKIRCGHGMDKTQRQDEEISPIFLQFLDSVYQFLRFYHNYFEFNSRFLLTIADHVYSCRFTNFLFSCESQRVSFFFLISNSFFFSFSSN
jgi:rhodanese-related sulfurtransferase